MSNKRVYTVAKEFGMASKDLMDILAQANITVKSHMSTLSEQQQKDLLSFIRKAQSAQSTGAQKPEKTEKKPTEKAEDKKKKETAPATKQTPEKSKKKTQSEQKPAKKTAEKTKAKMPKKKDHDRGDTQVSPEVVKEAPRKVQEKSAPEVDAYEDKQYSDGTSKKHSDLKKSKKKKQKKEAKKSQAKEKANARPQDFEKPKAPKKKTRSQKRKERMAKEDVKGDGAIKIKAPLTVKEFADTVGISLAQVITKLIGLGVMATQNESIDRDVIEVLADELKLEIEFISEEDSNIEELYGLDLEDPEDSLVERPPVVTVMGHVDHGKTSILDVIKKSHVTASEAGGITQHIGAYQVTANGKAITFLDTPGHEAFTAMRSRGASITDIAILVVAADDGVMPQTREAIHHAKAAGVPIIVAINKIDRDGANPDRVRQELTEEGLVCEDWGGDTIMVEVSAKTKQGIPELLDMVLLVAEVLELKANPDRLAIGTIVEARLDKGKGPMATILVQKGTLTNDSYIVSGT